MASKPEPLCSLAARLIQNLTGAAHRIGLKMDEADLQPDEEVWLEKWLVKPANHKPAMEKLMTALSRLAPTKGDRCGTYLEEFFQEQRYKRRPGEKLTEWMVRFGVKGVKN